MGGRDFKRMGDTVCLDVRDEIRFGIIWQENRESVFGLCVCVCGGGCVCVQGCLFITCCVMTSATHHLPFLERVIDQPVFQYVSKIIPSRGTSRKVPSWPSSTALTFFCPKYGQKWNWVTYFFDVWACVCFDPGATSYEVFL